MPVGNLWIRNLFKIFVFAEGQLSDSLNIQLVDSLCSCLIDLAIIRDAEIRNEINMLPFLEARVNSSSISRLT